MIHKICAKRPCPVCGCHVVSPLFPVNLYLEDKGLPNQYEAVRCDYCGMCYANTTASSADYERYYRDFNYYGGNPGAIKSEEILRYQAIEALLRQYSGPQCEILDVGFGGGGLLCYLKSRGFLQTAGMDPSAESVNMLRVKGIEGFCGSLQQEPEKAYQGKYDVVISTNVLEHLFLPKLGMQNLRALLKTGGYAILTLPLFDDLSQYKLPLVNLINHEHINYFSLVSLRFLSELSGFCEIATKKIEIEREGSSVTYGALGVYRRIEGDMADWNTPYQDQHTGDVLKNYYNRQQILLYERFAFLEDLRQTQTPLAIWGAGTYLMQLWQITALAECNIAMIVDGAVQKQGSVFCGMTIRSPQTLQDFKGIVLIAAMRNNQEILESIRETGFQGTVKQLGM